MVDEPQDYVYTSEDDELEDQQALDSCRFLRLRIEVSAICCDQHKPSCREFALCRIDPGKICVMLQALLKDRAILYERLKKQDISVECLRALADALRDQAATLAAVNANLIALKASLQRAHSVP